MLKRSLLAQLEAEEVLFVELETREDGSHCELVQFTFERFSDHAIATRLMDDHLDNANPSASFADGMTLYDVAFGKTPIGEAGLSKPSPFSYRSALGSSFRTCSLGSTFPGSLRTRFLKVFCGVSKRDSQKGRWS